MPLLTSCPVCASEDIQHSYTGATTRDLDTHPWKVYACRSCAHGFMNPLPTAATMVNYYASSYPPYDPSHGAGASDDEVVETARREGQFRHIRISAGDRLLDVGCGGGMFLRIAKRLGAEVQGIEPSPVGAARTRAQGIPVFEGTVEE